MSMYQGVNYGQGEDDISLLKKHTLNVKLFVPRSYGKRANESIGKNIVLIYFIKSYLCV